jgi:hypothetical protein
MYIYLNAWMFLFHLDLSVRARRFHGHFRALDSGFLESIMAFSHVAVLVFDVALG